MVEIILLSSFKHVYHDIAAFTLNEYGKTTLKKLTEEFITITKRLSSYPTSFPEERLLKNMPYKYRSIIFRKNFKIIYRYEDETNTIFRSRKVTFPRSTFVITCKSVIYNVV